MPSPDKKGAITINGTSIQCSPKSDSGKADMNKLDKVRLLSCCLYLFLIRIQCGIYIASRKRLRFHAFIDIGC